MEKNLPKEAGFYWARSDSSMGWYNLILNVYGEFPFFRINGWKLSGREPACYEMHLMDIADFGPQIPVPEVPPEIVKGSTF